MKILCDSGIVEGRKEGKWTHYKILAVIYVLVGLVIAIAGGTLIEKLHLDNQVEEYIKNCKMLDIPQEELHFKDRMKYAWDRFWEPQRKCFRMFWSAWVLAQLFIIGFRKILLLKYSAAEIL